MTDKGLHKKDITKEEYSELVKQEMLKLLEDGEACYHFQCLSHVNHPCEVCGRIAGIRKK